MHNVSEMKQIVEVGNTSMQIFPVLLIGQVFLHSYLHFLGLHLSGLIMAILNLSSASILDNKQLINNKHIIGNLTLKLLMKFK